MLSETIPLSQIRRIQEPKYKSNSWIAKMISTLPYAFFLPLPLQELSINVVIYRKIKIQIQGYSFNRYTWKRQSLNFSSFVRKRCQNFPLPSPCLSDVYQPMDTMSTRHQSLAHCGFQVSSFSFLSNSDNNVMWFTYPAFSIYLHMDKKRRIPQEEIQIFWDHGSNVIPISQNVCCYQPLCFSWM